MAGHKKHGVKLDTDIAAAAGLPEYVPLNDDAVRIRLLELRDRALNATLEIVRSGSCVHAGTWQNVYERAAATLERMEDRASGGTGRPVAITIQGCDLHRIVFGSSAATTGTKPEPE